MADNQGLPLAVATPQGGQHHDTFDLATVFAELCDLLQAAALRLDGLLLKADKAFDVQVLRQACARRAIELNVPRTRRSTDWQTADDTLLIPELSQRRRVIGQLNAWLDSFKTLLVRFETCWHTWFAFHWLAFFVLLLRKISRQPTS